MSDYATSRYGHAFAIGVTLNIIYVALEAGFGFWTGSLALLSDAGHNLSDVFGLLVAWGGHALAQVSPSRDAPTDGEAQRSSPHCSTP